MENSLFARLPFDPIYLFLIMLILIVILFLMVISQMNTTKRLILHYKAFMRGKDGKSLEQTMGQAFHELDQMELVVRKHEDQMRRLDSMFSGTYQKTGIVRYDAFQEMGGKLSFALTLLDDTDTGIILNVMHSREGCYTYAKEIIKGESFIALSEEEQDSLNKAMNIEGFLDE